MKKLQSFVTNCDKKINLIKLLKNNILSIKTYFLLKKSKKICFFEFVEKCGIFKEILGFIAIINIKKSK